MQRQLPTPAPPMVTSPSPTPSGQHKDADEADYFGTTGSSTRRSTRLASKRTRSGGLERQSEEDEGDDLSDSEHDSKGDISTSNIIDDDENSPSKPRRRTARQPPFTSITNGTHSPKLNSTLRPPNTSSTRPSRSPSPLGLIPLHTRFRSTIHRHELPRKCLHASIGVLTLSLYTRGLQTRDIHPTLLTLLVPITAVELLRHHFPAVNRVYVRCLGALMRENEVKDRWNGVVWYLLGAWGVLRFAPKDVGVVSVVLLSWCDTAASTIGRRWGRYTPRIGGKGKSLAGSLAAAVVGVGVGWLFWGWIAPFYHANGVQSSEGVDAFAFTGRLGVPGFVRGALGWREDEGVVGGAPALAVLSLVTGVVASAAEAIDLFGWDDNVTIPLLCGAGLWGFLRVFGA